MSNNCANLKLLCLNVCKSIDERLSRALTIVIPSQEFENRCFLIEFGPSKAYYSVEKSPFLSEIVNFAILYL